MTCFKELSLDMFFRQYLTPLTQLLTLIMALFRCPSQPSDRRIGKAVQFRRVPNAVRTMTKATCHWRKPGRRFGQMNPSQKTGLKNTTYCKARQCIYFHARGMP